MNMTDSDKLWQRVNALSQVSDTRFVELAKALYALKKADEERFAEYIGLQDRGRRKTYYLLQIGQAFSGLDVSDADLQEIGWTKLLRLAPFVDASNVADLTKRAKSMTYRQLDASLKGEKTLKARHAITLFLTPAQRALLARHLRRNGATRSGNGLEGKEEALTRLLKHYEQLVDGAKAKPIGAASSE